MFQNGLVRFATEKYESVNEENKSNFFQHLTNFAVNKDHPDFISSNVKDNEDRKSHKRSIKNFFEELKEKEEIDTEGIWESIGDMVVKTLASV